MLDEIIEERVQALATGRDNLERLKGQVTQLEAFLAELEQVVKHLQAVARKEQQPQFADRLNKLLNEYNLSKATQHTFSSSSEQRQRPIRDGSYRIFKTKIEPGTWIHYSDLMKQVEGLGVQIGGQRPEDNFLNHLSQDERFIRKNGRSLWSLREWFPDYNQDKAKQNGTHSN